MKIGQQLQKLRADNKFSQEDVAQKIYVSRQTISNWENNKCYPDVKSLLLLSNLFNVSLDNLVKGDIEEMKHEIKADDIKKVKRSSNIFSILLLSVIILPIPLLHFLDYIGFGIWAILSLFSIYYAIKIEKMKKLFDIQTYKEILSFVEGKSLNSDIKNQEKAKRPYQKVLLAISSATISVIVTIIMILIFR